MGVPGVCVGVTPRDNFASSLPSASDPPHFQRGCSFFLYLLGGLKAWGWWWEDGGEGTDSFI